MQPSMKLSEGKTTYPGAKRVHRFGDDTVRRDVLARADETDLGGRDLLVDVVTDGEVVYDVPPLEESRERAQSSVERLPAAVRAVEDPATYPVHVSDRLEETTEQVQSTLRREMGL